MFVVIEMQKLSEDNVATIVNSYSVLPVAEQKYHTVLAAAAVSSVPCHSAVMLNESGEMLKHEFYVHEVISNE